ncbi:MAG: outer membrane protein assembly factor BamB family protein [Candidatus Bathyarchaeia archaeon]
MLFSRSKSKIATTITLLLLFATLFMTCFSVKAQDENQPHGGTPGASAFPSSPPAGVTPDLITTVTPYLSFRPNPIGKGQSLLVNVWTTPPPAANRYLAGYTITITKPDETKETVGPINSYVADGTAWFEYVPDQVGNYTLKFDFAGTYFPAGTYINGVLNGTGAPTGFGGTAATYVSTWFKPASTAVQSLTVQQNQVASWPPSGLPTGYWTRPVSPENREWSAVLGNYPWPYFNEARDYLGPYVIAPNTAHVVWRRQGIISGIMGGDTGTYSLNTRENSDPGVIYAGRAYMDVNKPGVGLVAQCFDIRTGQVYYEIPYSQGGYTPLIISYVEGTSAVPGAVPALSAELIAADRSGLAGQVRLPSRLIKIDPWTGLVTTNVTGMTGIFYNNELVLSVQDLGSTVSAANRYRLINWTTVGSSTNFTDRILGNITFPVSSLPTDIDFDKGIGVQINRFGAGQVYGGNLYSINMVTGKLLWNITTDPETPFSGSCSSIEDGKVAVVFEDRFWKAFDIYTGAVVWKSDLLDYPWGDFWSYQATSAYGMIYAGSYTAFYALNWTNGKVAWKFESPATPFETPYTTSNGTSVYSWHSASIAADGKIFTYTSEHTPSEPITRGWHFYALNATTGQELWQLTGSGIDSRRFRGSAADGYLAIQNTYDGFMYIIGKGPSAVTVSAPQSSNPEGTSLLIQGTVMDMSPGKPNTPCVSKESMSNWMDYLYLQHKLPTNVTGVPVFLTAIDPNGNAIDIGTTKTNGFYGGFTYDWTPPKVGSYTIIASFAGDDSYGDSSAATGLKVIAAPITPTSTASPAQSTTESPIGTFTLAALVVLIILVIVVIVIQLRRR